MGNGVNKEEYLSAEEVQLLILKELREIKKKMPDQKIDLGILDAADVLQNLKISPRTLHNWTKKGLLRCVKIEGKLFYKADDIKGLFKELFNRK